MKGKPHEPHDFIGGFHVNLGVFVNLNCEC